MGFCGNSSFAIQEEKTPSFLQNKVNNLQMMRKQRTTSSETITANYV